MDDQKISEIKSQLEKLKSLEKDGLLPSDVYKQAIALAKKKQNVNFRSTTASG